MKGDISAMKGDISAVEGDISALKGDISAMKGDISVWSSSGGASKRRFRIFSIYRKNKIPSPMELRGADS
jgi:hypothetical protein